MLTVYQNFNVMIHSSTVEDLNIAVVSENFPRKNLYLFIVPDRKWSIRFGNLRYFLHGNKVYRELATLNELAKGKTIKIKFSRLNNLLVG